LDRGRERGNVSILRGADGSIQRGPLFVVGKYVVLICFVCALPYFVPEAAEPSEAAAKGDFDAKVAAGQKYAAEQLVKSMEEERRRTAEAKKNQQQFGTYELLRTMEHDTSSFTQGFEIDPGSGLIYEGTGLYGQSRLRKLDMKTGAPVWSSDYMGKKFFGEGITIIRRPGGQDILLQLTWRERTAFVYSLPDMELIKKFEYTTETNEGWGAAYNAATNQVVISDGSAWLMFWDADTFEELRRVRVRMGKRAIHHLNEIDMYQGDLLANVWFQDKILRIELESGNVKEVYDFTDLWPKASRPRSADCFNGIAVDHERDTVYLTGKLWPKVYEVKLIAPP